jgi:iron complex outermembrane receptor protein
VPAAGALLVERSYWDYLPSLNLKYYATDDVLLRFAASKTLTRPNLTDISPTTSANGNGRTVTQNNPSLDPFRATNFDLSADWYFAKDGLVGGALFYKDLESLIRRETTIQAYPVTYVWNSTGQTTTNTLDFTVSRLVNGSGVKVKGVELYYQQAFTFLPAPFDGFGTILNYTFIDNSDPTQLTAASKHNYNAIGYYEKGRLGVRLSYSWRDGFLQSAALAPAMSTEVMDYGSLDGSIQYKFSKHASLVLEGNNLLDEDEFSRYTTFLPNTYVDAGRKVVLSARFSF